MNGDGPEPEAIERLPDEFEAREGAFVTQQGISEVDYAELLDLAAQHAHVTPAVLGAPAWRFVGPRNIGGRIISLAQSPDDPRIIYAGSAHGGVWRSIDAGDTWERLGDAEHVFPVGAMAVAPGAPNVLYVGTGALNPHYVSGRGLYRVTIAGTMGAATFERLVPADSPIVSPRSATPGAALRYTRIRVDPDDPTRFWAASQTGLWRCECPRVVHPHPHFTRDFPNADNQPAALLDAMPANGIWPSYCTDLLLARDPREDGTVTVGKEEVPRYLILFVAIDSVGVFRGRFDRDSGKVEFEDTKLDLPDPALSFNRIRLAQCERKPNHVYAIMADKAGNVASEVYRSQNSGSDWTKGSTRIAVIGAASGQADYDLVLEVAPDDPRIVIVGAVELCISRDSGDTWDKILDQWQYDAGDPAQHADQHIAMFDRGDHRRLWVGNDGGLSLARNLRRPAQSFGYWRKRSHGIFAGECQDVSANPSLPFMCATGLQDSGSYLSFGGPTWLHVGGADGGAVAFNLPNPRQLAVTWQGRLPVPDGRGIEQVDVVAPDLPLAATAGAWWDLVTRAAGDLPESIARGHAVRYRWTSRGLPPSGMVTPAPFVGVLEQHPSIPGQLLAGRKGDAYVSLNFGVNWSPLIPAGPPPPAPPVPAVPLAPGGEVSAVAFGPVEPHNLAPGQVDAWAGTSAGTLFFTKNDPAGGWARLPTALPFPGAPLRISEIAVHPLDRRIVAVSATGLQGRVFLTHDRGRTWIDVTEPTPTALTVAPVGASVHVGETRHFTASARYADGSVVDVTARAAWSSNLVGKATVGTSVLGPFVITGFGTEGHVRGAAVGAPSPIITATLLVGVPNGSAAQGVTITPAIPDPPPVPPRPVRTVVPGSLPPGPVGSVVFDPSIPAAAPMTLLAGGLVGVFALTGVPTIAKLEIEPAGPFALQKGGVVLQLRCVAVFTDTTRVDMTNEVDWSSSVPGRASVSNVAPSIGQVTTGAATGAVEIKTHRGSLVASLVINVQAGAVPAPGLPAAPAALHPTITVDWQQFNHGLPHVLVTDFERVGTTNAIRASTFGLGVFECVTTGGPQQRLYVRQTIVEDGRYASPPAPARPAAPPLPDDPRLPAGVVALDYTHAFDIRVDAPPYAFFDDVVDGVEFDELLEVSDPVPTEDNYIYVQVHNAGTTAVPLVSVHLYAAECAGGDVINPIGPVKTDPPASLNGAGAKITDFYGKPNFDPIAGSKWKRVDVVRVLDEVPSDRPRVACFTWSPDPSLAEKNVALLALCSGHSSSLDELPPAPVADKLSDFIRAERRAALRIVHVAPRPAASLYIRDGIADDTRVGGYPVGGRSPDIMVVHPDVGGTAEDAFTDHMARRPHDTVSKSSTTFVYVRVHNRRRFQTKVNVKLFAVPLNDANQPDTAFAKWNEQPFRDATVPPSGVGYARFELPALDDPNPSGTNKAYLLLALFRSDEPPGHPIDLLPTKESVDSVDAFWDLVAREVDSDNAAARAVPWVP